MELADFSHGKRKVRIGKVRRLEDNVQSFVEYEVAVQLEGATEASYLSGDNSMVIATDTVKNNCYVVAKTNDMTSPEDYSIALANHFLNEYEFVTGVRVTSVEKPWMRAEAEPGREHVHGFVRGSHGDHVAYVELRRSPEGPTLSVIGKIEGMDVLKTTMSGWEKFHDCKYTTLPSTNDRILATTVSASWKFTSTEGIDYYSVYKRIRESFYMKFYGPPETGEYSPGVQATQYQMGSLALERCPEISEISLVLPNIHFLPCKIPAFEKNGIKFENDVFIPTDEPQGDIYCRITRPST